MSIILEALKKASPTKDAAPSAGQKIETKDVAGPGFLKTMLTASAVIVTVTIVVFLTASQSRVPAGDGALSAPPDKTKTDMIAEGYTTAPALPAPKQETTPINDFITKLSSPRLTLNGIVYGIGRPAAIIENKILEEGASIKGAKIVKIHDGSVEMLNEATGQAFILKVD